MSVDGTVLALNPFADAIQQTVAPLVANVESRVLREVGDQLAQHKTEVNAALATVTAGTPNGQSQLALGLAQGVQSNLDTLATDLGGRLTALETQAQQAVSQAIPVVTAQLQTAAVATIDSAAHDPRIPLVIIGGLVGAALLILAFYLAGSHAAADIVGWLLPLILASGGLSGKMLLTTATTKPVVGV